MAPNLTASQMATINRAERDAVAVERQRVSPIVHRCAELGIDPAEFLDDATMTVDKLNEDPAVKAADKWKREYESNPHLRERMNAREYYESRARDDGFASLRWATAATSNAPAIVAAPTADDSRPPICGPAGTPHGVGSDPFSGH